MSKRKNGCLGTVLKWIGIVFAAIFAIGLIGTMFSNDPEETNPTETTAAWVQESTVAITPQESIMPTEPTSIETTTGATTEQTMPVESETTPQNSTFSIHFIDVGQADAALVECDGHYMLIDGGNKADSNVIYTVLKTAGVKKLDIVVGTHAHEDHIGGLPGAFNYTTADLTLCPVKSYDSKAFEDFANYATQKGGGIVIPKKNDTYSLGSSKVTILSLNGGSDTNNTSIILRIDYGETSFLFTGDAELEAEQAILNTVKPNLKATVLKVGHHGSDTSTSYSFLKAISPEYAVISVGTDNSYGHPTETVLSRLRDAEVKVFRTDLQGDIHCSSDGKTVSFSTDKNFNAETLTPAVSAKDLLEKVVSESCNNYNSNATRILGGVLSYKILNATEVELIYAVSDLIYSDTEYIVDEVNKEILNYVVSDINNAGLPESVSVNVTSNYELSSTGSQTEEPKPTETPTPSEDMVWIPNSGSKYHSYSGCSNMKNPSKVTKSQAIAWGYTACKKCW